jgi:hypothetical protein
MNHNDYDNNNDDDVDGDDANDDDDDDDYRNMMMIIILTWRCWFDHSSSAGLTTRCFEIYTHCPWCK